MISRLEVRVRVVCANESDSCNCHVVSFCRYEYIIQTLEIFFALCNFSHRLNFRLCLNDCSTNWANILDHYSSFRLAGVSGDGVIIQTLDSESSQNLVASRVVFAEKHPHRDFASHLSCWRVRIRVELLENRCADLFVEVV